MFRGGRFVESECKCASIKQRRAQILPLFFWRGGAPFVGLPTTETFTGGFCPLPWLCASELLRVLPAWLLLQR